MRDVCNVWNVCTHETQGHSQARKFIVVVSKVPFYGAVVGYGIMSECADLSCFRCFRWGFFQSFGRLVKTKLKLTTLPRSEYVSCFNSTRSPRLQQQSRLLLYYCRRHTFITTVIPVSTAQYMHLNLSLIPIVFAPHQECGHTEYRGQSTEYRGQLKACPFWDQGTYSGMIHTAT